MIKRYIYSKLRMEVQGVTCLVRARLRRCSCHSRVRVESIAEDFASLLEKFLLQEENQIFRSTTLDEAEHHSVVVVGTTKCSNSFMGH